MSVLNPNISREELSDDNLIFEYYNQKKYKKRQLYEILSVRCNENDEIKELLLNIIKDKDARVEIEFGFIKHAWLPLIYLLKNGSTRTINDLKEILKKWDFKEKQDLLDYIKQDAFYYETLKDIIY
jgi:hypothetical protein